MVSKAFLETVFDVFEASWGAFWASWGSLGGLLEPLGALLKASSGLLGASWALLGASWALLKRCKQNLKNERFQNAKEGGLRPSFLGGIWEPKSTKMASKTSQNLRRFSRAKKLLFKSVLEPSWADLGAFWGPSWDS